MTNTCHACRGTRKSRVIDLVTGKPGECYACQPDKLTADQIAFKEFFEGEPVYDQAEERMRRAEEDRDRRQTPPDRNF